MKFYSLVVLTVVLPAVLSRPVLTFLRNPESDSLQKAFSNITNALAQRNHVVSIMIEGKPSDEMDLSSFASTAGIPHVVNRLEYGENFTLNSSAIVSLESGESLNNFNINAILLRTFSMKQQLVIHCRDGSYPNLSLNRVDQPIIQYEYFLVEEAETINLLTFLWYIPTTCSHQRFVVNSFDKVAGRWAHPYFRIDKFTNFNGCRITFLMANYNTGEFYDEEIDHEKKTVTECKGITCAIVKDFSSVLNYSYQMDVFFGFNKSRLWPEIPFDVRFDFGSLMLPNKKVRYVDTRAYEFTEYFFTVPPGEEFNGYEKMILPFDEDTWMWILITFASAFVTIFVLRFVSKDIANFIIGKGISTPGLNVIRAFFGVSQIVCPGRNFARYLLMMFILFSLVIRTAYQGKMFEFLQKEMRKPTVTTVEEMIEQNFTFYTERGFKKAFTDFDLVKKGNVIDDWEEPKIIDAFKRTYLPGSKTSCYYRTDIYQSVARSTNRFDPPLLLKKRIILVPRTLVFRPYNFMFDELDRKLQLHIKGGFVNQNTKDYYRVQNPEQYAVLKEPFAVLTFDQLEAGFVVCLVPFVLSIFVFAFEWMTTFKDLILFLFVFKKYFEVVELEQSKRSQVMKKKFAALQAAKQDKERDDAERDNVYELCCL